MLNDIPQFGTKPESVYKNRPCVYVIVYNKHEQILCVEVGQTLHLPGGGINKGEDPVKAVLRETEEETGCKIADLHYIGHANQYFIQSKIGSINKIGIFYKARLVHEDPFGGDEAGHKKKWLSRDEFINSAAGDFQKWAVKKAADNLI